MSSSEIIQSMTVLYIVAMLPKSGLCVHLRKLSTMLSVILQSAAEPEKRETILGHVVYVILGQSHNSYFAWLYSRNAQPAARGPDPAPNVLSGPQNTDVTRISGGVS